MTSIRYKLKLAQVVSIQNTKMDQVCFQEEVTAHLEKRFRDSAASLNGSIKFVLLGRKETRYYNYVDLLNRKQQITAYERQKLTLILLMMRIKTLVAF